MLISDVIALCPDAVTVLERHGLGCAACLAAGMESLSSVATVHDVSLETLIKELNRSSDEPSGEPWKEPGL
jgi:hybrid cluster-associated redox disulfide protein